MNNLEIRLNTIEKTVKFLTQKLVDNKLIEKNEIQEFIAELENYIEKNKNE